jgi:hypothetical protein
MLPASTTAATAEAAAAVVLEPAARAADISKAMLRRVLAQPRRTAARWEWLMATDGLRFDPWEHREHYEDSPCWNRLRSRWNREQAKLNAQPLAA